MAKSLVSCFFDSQCICAPVLELWLRSCKTEDKEYRFRPINFIFTVKARQSDKLTSRVFGTASTTLFERRFLQDFYVGKNVGFWPTKR